jgi:hypothetical protein
MSTYNLDTSEREIDYAPLRTLALGNSNTYERIWYVVGRGWRIEEIVQVGPIEINRCLHIFIEDDATAIAFKLCSPWNAVN